MTTSSPKLSQVMKAVFGAMIGVQSEKQRQDDFKSQSPIPYLVAGIIATILFVLILLLVVSLVLA